MKMRFDKNRLLSVALAQILDTPNAGQLLLGLNELLGSASEYTITGSVALAFHHLRATGNTMRIPNDLDVIVSESAMERLGNVDRDGLRVLGFESPPGNVENIVWHGDKNRPLNVDIIKAGDNVESRGFRERIQLQGNGFVPLDQLKRNMEIRINSNVHSDQTLGDLAIILAMHEELTGNG